MSEDGVMLGVIILCVLFVVGAIYGLTETVRQNWLYDCVAHRPLADCKRDWEALKGP